MNGTFFLRRENEKNLNMLNWMSSGSSNWLELNGKNTEWGEFDK